ncbi:MAG: hypothetical protein JW733_06795 [Coriobacteriia bacterium]|nr:hypothetical protein [Coriobacteriia bacterium]MBN2839920.1 hypothetical protein [Coriobacteriia bacterium]
MAVQLTFPVCDQGGRTLDGELRSLVSTWSIQTGAATHADTSAAITGRHFVDWGGRPLTISERRRVEAYFRGVLRRRIIAGRDADAREARSLMVARSIEEDLVLGGWERAQATRQAYATAGIVLSA